MEQKKISTNDLSIKKTIPIINEIISTEETFTKCFKSLAKILNNPVFYKKIHDAALQHGIDDKIFAQMVTHIKNLAQPAPFIMHAQNTGLDDNNAKEYVENFLISQQNLLLKIGTAQSRTMISRHISIIYLALFYQTFPNFNAKMFSKNEDNQELTNTLNHNGLDWNALIINAIQRMPRYELLWKNIYNEFEKIPDEDNENSLKKLATTPANLYHNLTGEMNAKILRQNPKNQKPFTSHINILTKIIDEQIEQLKDLSFSKTEEEQLKIIKEKETLLINFKNKLKECKNHLDKLNATELHNESFNDINQFFMHLKNKISELPTLAVTDEIKAFDQSINYFLNEINNIAIVPEKKASLFSSLSAKLSSYTANSSDDDKEFFKLQCDLILPLVTSQPIKIAAEQKKSIYVDDILIAFQQEPINTLTHSKLNVTQSAIAHINSVYYGLDPKILNNEQYATIAINVDTFPHADLTNQSPKTNAMTVSVYQHLDCQNLAAQLFKEDQSEGVLVMNAANRFSCGGGWSQAYGTQEESLFFTYDISRRLYPLTNQSQPLPGIKAYYTEPMVKPSNLHLDALPAQEALPEDNENVPVNNQNMEKSHIELETLNDVQKEKPEDNLFSAKLPISTEPTHALYTSNAICFRKANSLADTFAHRYQPCKPFKNNIISIAGYDLRIYKNQKGEIVTNFERELFTKNGTTLDKVDWELFEKKTAELYELCFNVALQRKDRVIIAVPLSCGAFAYQEALNSTREQQIAAKEKTSEHVAKAFATVLEKYNGYFDSVHMVAIDPIVAKQFTEILNNKNLLTISPVPLPAQSPPALPPLPEATVKQPTNASSEKNSKNNFGLFNLFNKNKDSEISTPVAELEKFFSEKLKLALDFDFKKAKGKPEGLRTVLARRLFFMLNPSVDTATKTTTPTSVLCQSATNQPNYMVNFTCSGFSINIIEKEKIEQLATACKASNIPCSIACSLQKDSYTLYIPRQHLVKFLGFFFASAEHCMNIMYKDVLHLEQKLIDQASELWEKIKPNTLLPIPLQDFYIDHIIKILNKEKINTHQFKNKQLALLKEFPELSPSMLYNDVGLSEKVMQATLTMNAGKLKA